MLIPGLTAPQMRLQETCRGRQKRGACKKGSGLNDSDLSHLAVGGGWARSVIGYWLLVIGY
jgi:hypothetical protein